MTPLSGPPFLFVKAMATTFLLILTQVLVSRAVKLEKDAERVNGKPDPRELSPEAAESRKMQLHSDAAKQLVELSDMMPQNTGRCPEIEGYVNKEKLFTDSEVHPCTNMLRRDEAEGKCLIYNFGVGTRDPFLEELGREYKGCEVFAFDPFVTPNDGSKREDQAPKFTPNVKFFSLGLGDSGPIDWASGLHGKLKTMHEIQKDLGHVGRRLSLLRADCEGCEYWWVDKIIQDDPSFFDRVDQMFTELHFVRVDGYSDARHAMPDWQYGLPPRFENSVPSIHKMMDKFLVTSSSVNPGMPLDRDEVPDDLNEAGVISYPCCREFNMVSKAAGVKSSKHRNTAVSSLLESKLVRREAPSSSSTPEAYTGLSLANMEKNLAALFKGLKGTCPDGKKAKTFGRMSFCEDMLRASERSGRCFIYQFGVRTKHEIALLKYLGSDFKDCYVNAFDMTQKRNVWTPGYVRKTFGENVFFKPWGLYSGLGPRTVRTVDPTSKKSVIGELYTLAEIHRSWLKAANFSAQHQPKEISLLRLDVQTFPQEVWEEQLAAKSCHWWGCVSGLDSLRQLSA